jgi:acetoin utilization deacetylase AcuC-like enzyme
MLALYTHASCLAHDPGPGHPECPQRLQAVLQGLAQIDPARLEWIEAPCCPRPALLRVHTAEYLDRVQGSVPQHGRVALDPDTAMNPASLDAALHAAGAVVAAVDAVLSGRHARAFCAVRPPGHHALADRAMGFCLFNNVAVAAAHALAEHGLTRVAVVDFDVHHGNGTQAMFWHEPRVLFLSSHQWPLYPGSGRPEERGAHGNVHNLILPPGAGSTAFRTGFEQELLPVLERFAPQLILISAGFDAHRLDPLANLNLLEDDYAWVTRALVACAERHASGRVVSTLEGGYSLSALRACARVHAEALT